MHLPLPTAAESTFWLLLSNAPSVQTYPLQNQKPYIPYPVITIRTHVIKRFSGGLFLGQSTCKSTRKLPALVEEQRPSFQLWCWDSNPEVGTVENLPRTCPLPCTVPHLPTAEPQRHCPHSPLCLCHHMSSTIIFNRIAWTHLWPELPRNEKAQPLQKMQLQGRHSVSAASASPLSQPSTQIYCFGP